MLDTPAERNLLFMSIMEQHSDFIAAQARASSALDDLQEIALKILTSSPDFLLPEYGQDAGPWLRTVLWNKNRQRHRDENNRERIVRERAAELADLYHAGTSPSAESIVLRKLEEEEIRKKILRLPPKLRPVAALKFDGWSGKEISKLLGISESAVWNRMERIRSGKIRRALGLEE